jgi:hypothetical protein
VGPPIFSPVAPTAYLGDSLPVAVYFIADYGAQILATADLCQLPSYRFRRIFLFGKQARVPVGY